MKRALTGIAAAGIALGMLTPMAFAANTTNTTAKVVGTKAVVVNGKMISSPYELTNIDSGNTTAYFGIYYFDQAVKALGQGFDASWDGTNHVWNITAPNLDASKIAGGLGSGNTAIKINGTTVKYINTFSHVDPAGGGQTTYFPVWYVNEILSSIGAQGQWNPQGGLVANYTVGAPATISLSGGGAVSNVVGTTTTLSAKVVDSNGHPVPGVKVDFQSSNGSILSVPASATTDANGVATITGTVGVNEGAAYIQATVDSNPNLTSTATVSVQQLAVASAVMLNSEQIQYTFNEAVDATDAQNISNYTLTNFRDAYGNAVTSGTPTISSAALQPDGKTVIVTLSGPVTNGDSFTFGVSGVHAYNNSNRVEPNYATSLTANNTAAPAIASVSAQTNGIATSSVTVTFSEPVPSLSASQVTIDGTAVSTANVVAGTNNEVWTLTPASVLSASTSHTLTAYAVTDAVGNTADTLTQSFTVVADSTAPTVSVSPASDHQIELTFSKPVNAAAVEANTVVNTAGTTTPNLVTSSDVTVDPTDTTYDGTYATKFVVSIPNTVSLYSSSSTASLVVTLPGGTISDKYGNDLSGTTQSVSLMQNTTAPVLTGLTYVTDPVTGKVTDIVVNLSKGVNGYGSSLSTAGLQVIQNSTGNDVTTGFFTADASSVSEGDTSIELPLATAQSLSGSYTINFPASWIYDDTNSMNTNAATSLTVNFGSGAGTFQVAQAGIANAIWNGDGTETIKVDYSQGTNGTVYGGTGAGSATLASDYTLNGAALPSGTVITMDATNANEVDITLPAGSVAKDNSYASFTVRNVLNTDGVTVSPFTGYVGVLDNTAPVLQSAQVISATQVLLTFNEAMTAGGTITLLNNGGSYTATTTAVAGNPNELLATYSSGLNLNYNVQVTTSSSTSYPVTVADASTEQNVVAGGTTITATPAS